MTNQPGARVIADSITADGHRLTTVEATCWRPVLAEQNTHCVLARNSASSRAIPIARNLARFTDEFMYPEEWGAERPGMQPGPPLEGDALKEAMKLWDDLSAAVAFRIQAYLWRNPLKDADQNDIEGATRLHKSLLNRWLEVGLSQTQIITATRWDGYFWQRCDDAADANIRAMAVAIRTAMEDSEPKLLRPGKYHLPYFGDSGGAGDQDWGDAERLAYEITIPDIPQAELVTEIAKRVSSGRCARVSYLNQDGVRDLQEDVTLFERLADRSDDPERPPHASPLEHIATPWPENVQHVTMPNGRTMGPLPKLGKFTGWWQFRHENLEF